MPKRKLKVNMGRPVRRVFTRNGDVQLLQTQTNTPAIATAPKKQMTSKKKAVIAGAVVGAAAVTAVAAGVGIAIAKHKKTKTVPKPKPHVPEFDTSLEITPRHEINHKAIFDNEATHNHDVGEPDFSKEWDDWLAQDAEHTRNYSTLHQGPEFFDL
jgi:hypothetical protein